VEIRGREVSGEAVVSVADEGIGIPLAAQARIFEPFHRVDDSSTRRTSGAGLGLYLAREIVSVHGGRLWVESEPGEGSTFFFSLPLVDEGEESAD
jgi:signal transduction histidine kinase